MSIDIVEYLPGMELGRGFDLLENDPKILPAVKGNVGKLGRAKGQVSGAYDILIVRSIDEFQQALGIDASVSVGLGVAGGSVKAKFEEKCKVTSEATFCVVSFSAVNAPMSLRGEVALTDEALELLQLKDERRFRQRYGTHFCSDIYSGVQFLGSIQITASSQQRQEEVALSIQAKYGPGKGSFKMESSSSSSSSDYSLTMFTLQSGGIMQPVSTLEDLFEAANRVARQGSKGLATPTHVVLGSYDELELPWDGISTLAQQHAQKEMRRLKKLYDQLREDRNNIDFVLSNPEKYVSFDSKKFARAKAQITASLKQIVDLSDQCAKDYASYSAKEPEMPVIELPERKNEGRRNARLKRDNKVLRSRNMAQRARILLDKANDLQPGKRRTRLETEAAELVKQARELRKEARNSNPAKPRPAVPGKRASRPETRANASAKKTESRRRVQRDN